MVIFQFYRLLNLSELEKYDSQQMYKVYDNWPEIAKNAYDLNLKSIEYTNVNNIIFCGMGGSGAIGDIFASILSKTSIHVSVVKGYVLPKTIDQNSLVVVTSVSGNTVETLTVLKQAKDLNCKIIAFSSGGEIEKYCIKNEIEYRKIQKIHSPRAAFTNYLYSILKILEPIIPINEEMVLQSIIELEKTKKIISSDNLNSENISLKLAEWIKGIPIIYYPFGLQSVAIRFKNSLQENSKKHVMCEDILEACHNGIVAWENLSSVQPILLKGEDDYIKTKERWKIINEYFSFNQIEFKEVFSIKGDILTKIINMIYVLDYASIYLAILSKTDPSPVQSISYIKSKIEK